VSRGVICLGIPELQDPAFLLPITDFCHGYSAAHLCVLLLHWPPFCLLGFDPKAVASLHCVVFCLYLQDSGDAASKEARPGWLFVRTNSKYFQVLCCSMVFISHSRLTHLDANFW
jgi:hypothetical protein